LTRTGTVNLAKTQSTVHARSASKASVVFATRTASFRRFFARRGLEPEAASHEPREMSSDLVLLDSPLVTRHLSHPFFECAVSSVVEHYLDTVGVSGSNPLSRTTLIQSGMRNSSDVLKSAVAAASETLQSILDLDLQLTKAAELIVACLTTDHKILACGNGGSAADAADFCTEFACRFVQDRRPYPALNLAEGGSLLTATGNDYGFDEIFARQVAAYGIKDDLLICLTTSGKSKNVRRALEEAKSRKLKTIALLGRDGGSTVGIANVDLVIKGDSTARIQEAHKFLLHVLCEICEERLPRK